MDGRKPTLEPLVVWLGDVPISHGERDDDSGACLCGEPSYLECPMYLAGAGIFDLTIYPVEP